MDWSRGFDEVNSLAFDVRKLFLTERAKHLAICSRCQRRLEYWSGMVENFDRATPLQEGRDFSLLNRIALNLLKQDKTCKLGVHGKRLAAAWDHDYLLTLLSGGN